MEIKANVKSILDLSNYYFVVPDYQREYVWKPEDHVEQFIVDIDNEYEVNASKQSKYFLGSIIIVKNDKNKFDVIDGQQRLTTIMLSLCALRDIMPPNSSDNLHQEYLKRITELLYNFDVNSDKKELRLELQYIESKNYLNNLINCINYDDEMTPSIEKMQQAYEKFKNHFNSYLNKGDDNFIKYIKYFLTSIEVVIIESENLSSALKIFETINQRGAGLNAMDLVKNLLFSEASKSEFQSIKEIWKEIRNNLQICKEDESPLRFLRYFLMARYHNGIIREDDIYKWIISIEGKKTTNYENQPLEFAKELKKISKRYSDLVLATELQKDGGDYPKITKVGFINKYKSRQHLILLLALDINCNKEVIEYLAEQIESYFFFGNTIGVQSKDNERLFSSWSKELRGVKSIDEITKVIERTMIPSIKDKMVQFKPEFLNLRHDAYNPLYRLRYILGKIENTILEKSNMPAKGNDFYNELQIEHILPQTPKDDKLPEEFKDKDEYFSFVYKLGNAALLESIINQAVNNCNDLSSDWFNKKQVEYLKSNMETIKLLNNNYGIGNNTALNRFKNESKYIFEKWNKDSINKRQSILMELALDSWKFNGKRIDKID